MQEKLVNVWFRGGVVKQVDKLVPEVFPNRNEAIREGVRMLLREYGLWNASVFTQKARERIKKQEVKNYDTEI